jgi:hypothetical protein
MRDLFLVYIKSRLRLLILKRIILTLVVIFFLINIFILRILVIDSAKCPGEKKLKTRYKPTFLNTSIENSCTENSDFKSNTQLNKSKQTHLTCFDQDWIKINSSGTVFFNFAYLITKKITIKTCKYWIISWHKNDYSHKYSESFLIDHGESLDTKSEFFYIECKSTKSEKYKSIFARIFEPLEKFKNRPLKSSRQKPLNIFLVGLDSVSREAWLTNLPESSDFLLNNLNASVLSRFNVVGDGTVAALTPMLTGKHEHELPDVLKSSFSSMHVDEVYPFIWKNFSEELDFASLFAEDWPSIGTFNYRLTGMKKQPTDHYMR